MRLYLLDQDEFESPSSEESLVVAVSHRRHFSDLQEFHEATYLLGVFEPAGSPSIARSAATGVLERWVGERLQKFRIAICNGDEKCLLLKREWNSMDILIESESLYIRYHWQTSA
jgi:hypothetical protein